MRETQRRTVAVKAAFTIGVIVAGSLAALALPTVAGAAVTSTASNAAPATDGNGYDWVSYYRQMAGLGTVGRDAGMESQEATHVRYLANHALSCETNVHDELTTRIGNCGANPYATAGGKAAANNSDITRVSASVPDRTAVSNWFGAAFHALTLLDPRLTTTGYAAYYTPNPTGAKPLAWNYTAGVDVYRGRKGRYSGMTVAFPANGASTPLLSYRIGTESPEPFQSSIGNCHSWSGRTVVSAPVIVQWPLSAHVNPGVGSIVDLTTKQAQSTCTLTAGSYQSGSLGRQFLAGANGITNAAFYYAATPFVAGHQYQLKVGNAVATTFFASALPSAVPTHATPASRSIALSWPRAAAGTVTLYVTRVYNGTGCTGVLVANLHSTTLSTRATGLVSGRVYSIRTATVNSSQAARWGPCITARSG
jgi:hypothetical protein